MPFLLRLKSRLAPALALGLILLGCQPPTSGVMTPRPENANPFEGIVMVSLTSNTGRVGQWGSIVAHRLESETLRAADFALSQVSTGLSRDTSLFIGSLPPGNYMLTQVGEGSTYIPFGTATQQNLGTFKVEEGKTTDLGRLILTSINDRFLTGRSQTIFDNTKLVTHFAPAQIPFLSRPRTLGWSAPPNEEDWAERYAQASPLGAEDLQELEGGVVAGGSRMGTVLLRTPTGQWRRTRANTLASLLSLAPCKGGTDMLVAVGEFKTIVKVDRKGTATLLDPGNLPEGNLFFIEGNDQDGWIVGHRIASQVSFYASPKVDAGTWTPIHQEEVKDTLFSGANEVFAWSLPTGFAFATKFGGMKSYSRKDKAWKPMPIPGDPNVASLSRGARWALSNGAGAFARVLTSPDMGTTWEDFTSPFAIILRPPCFVTKDIVLMQGGPTTSELKRSENGGATWVTVKAPIDRQDTLFVTPTQGIFAVDSGHNILGVSSIWHSKDNGLTWELEATTYDRKAWERSHPTSKN